MSIFGKSRSELVEENSDLRDTLNEYHLAKLKAEEDLARFNISRKADSVNFDVQVANLKNSHSFEVASLRSEILHLEKSLKTKVEDGLADGKRQLKKDKEYQDAQYAEKVKKLNAEYAEKLAKLDAKLEADKASYRKYLRSENNKTIENLEKDNKILVAENAEYRARAEASQGTVKILEAQLNSVTKFADSISGSMSKLSEKISEGMVKAIPTITADFSTPETPENHVHLEVPAGKVGGNNNNEKK